MICEEGKIVKPTGESTVVYNDAKQRPFNKPINITASRVSSCCRKCSCSSGLRRLFTPILLDYIRTFLDVKSNCFVSQDSPENLLILQSSTLFYFPIQKKENYLLQLYYNLRLLQTIRVLKSYGLHREKERKQLSTNLNQYI